MRFFFIALLALALHTQMASAKDLGLGVIVGSPTGVSAKYFLSKENAVDAAIGWDFGRHHDLHIHGDYLWIKPGILKIKNESFDLFFGFGMRIISWERYYRRDDEYHDDKVSLGVRGPVGLTYFFKKIRLEVFGELALVFDLVPATKLDADVGVGARYFF